MGWGVGGVCVGGGGGRELGAGLGNLGGERLAASLLIKMKEIRSADCWQGVQYKIIEGRLGDAMVEGHGTCNGTENMGVYGGIKCL